MTRTLALAIAVAVPSAPSIASDGNWQVGNDQVHIIDHKIDVSRPDGRRALLVRVRRAAQVVCRSREGMARDECERETIRETALQPNAWGRALGIALQENDPGVRLASNASGRP